MYEAYFGLRGKPFQLNPDPSFFYGSRGHRRAMAYLEYGLHQNEGFIVVTGEVGAGKTLLVRSLLEKLDPSRIVAANLVSTQIDADDILRLVAAAFGIPSKHLSKSDLLLAIEAFLVSTTAAGKRALLIVDEAQNLTQRAVEELRMLSNFQLEDHALLQSFLVGQPEFRSIMQSPEMVQLRQRVIASYHLGPLDVAETQAYVEHRLGCVGWKGNPAFEAEALKGIFNHSQGIPRRINALCDRIMLAAFLSDKHQVSVELVEQVAAEMSEEQVVPLAHQTETAVPDQVHSGGHLLRLLADPEASRTLAGLGAGYDTSRFEDRLALLERTLSTTLNALSQLIGAAEQRIDGEGKEVASK
ncbi:XrtA/PEP-CTERM system-associated ATPase [Zoogloea sp.]|uniref:XrtA/PEP-CTERM system-associated ATPase n=1 Tax=Zoogloea sp. TaxID=49181 RepID=UPI001AC9A6F7|nr:XrtA/PEP-CTERM system-associated ATPase [Zoogloea sp.]MBN8282073.1 AAA family ATPase [Zoogloea sp.]